MPIKLRRSVSSWCVSPDFFVGYVSTCIHLFFYSSKLCNLKISILFYDLILKAEKMCLITLHNFAHILLAVVISRRQVYC